ncbi:hypothetical protein [Halalkalibacterium ligniniphilum]|uniref:hypothetical protein n=1 Tax=Halalkalibacterium ligniniphilum TaxID=1134413 RepID=UPI0013755410|nr:hypothetical protein [Halalkalibacterium ligniniphilum]
MMMVENTDQILTRLVVRVIELEAREKALLKILVEKEVVDHDVFSKEISDHFESVQKDSMMDLLGVSEEEYKELERRNEIG